MATSEYGLLEMLLRDLVEDATASTGTRPQARSRSVRTGETPMQRAAGLRDDKSVEATDAISAHHDAIVEDLDLRATVKARKDVPALLSELADRGFSWRDIARFARVSVPAVRKWRAGGTHNAERRIDLARVASLCDLLEESLVSDPAGWLEMPLVKDVPVTWMDLYLAGRDDLVVDAASHRQRNVHAILDQFDSDWRKAYRSDYEVFEDVDGKPSIRARQKR